MLCIKAVENRVKTVGRLWRNRPAENFHILSQNLPTSLRAWCWSSGGLGRQDPLQTEIARKSETRGPTSLVRSDHHHSRAKAAATRDKASLVPPVVEARHPRPAVLRKSVCVCLESGETATAAQIDSYPDDCHPRAPPIARMWNRVRPDGSATRGPAPGSPGPPCGLRHGWPRRRIAPLCPAGPPIAWGQDSSAIADAPQRTVARHDPRGGRPGV